jgi:cytochrome c
MTDRFNTIAGWVLFCGIVALGLSIVSGMWFQGDKPHRPHELGYPIAGAVEEGAGGGGPSLAMVLATADPANGEKVFAKCSACHSIAQGGANGIGPNLYGVVGKPIGKHAAGFAYSDALTGKGGDWSFENLDHWLASPKAFAPGTKMSFAGLSNIEDRAAVIAYLNSQGANLPLPAAEAPAAEDAAATGDAAASEAAGDPTATAGPAEKPGAEAAGAVSTDAPAGGQVRQQSQNN